MAGEERRKEGRKEKGVMEREGKAGRKEKREGKGRTNGTGMGKANI